MSPTDMRYPFSARHSVAELGKQDYETLARQEKTNQCLSEKSSVETSTPQLTSADNIDPGGNEARSIQEYDPRKLWNRLSTFHLGGSPVHPFPFRDGLLAGHMYGAITALLDACAQGKFQHFPLLLNKAPPWLDMR